MRRSKPLLDRLELTRLLKSLGGVPALAGPVTHRGRHLDCVPRAPHPRLSDVRAAMGASPLRHGGLSQAEC